MEYIYYIILSIVIILSFAIKNTNSKILLILLIVTLSLFSGLRNIDVGIDTLNYYNIINNIKNGVYSPNVEYGFIVYSKIILTIFDNPTYVFLITALIINSCIITRFYLSGSKKTFPIACIWYYTFLFPQSCNIMRQYLAAAIVFLFTIFLERKSYRIFIIAVLAATTIHLSAIISLLLIPINILFSRDFKRREKKKLAIVLLLAIPIIAIYVSFSVEHYKSYLLSSANNKIGVLNIIRLAIAFFYIITNQSNFTHIKHCGFCKVKNSNLVPITLCYVIGIVFTSFGYYFTTMARLGLLYLFFEPIFVSEVSTFSKNRNLYRILYSILYIMYFILNVGSGWSGLSNYSFI